MDPSDVIEKVSGARTPQTLYKVFAEEQLPTTDDQSENSDVESHVPVRFN